MSCVFMIKVGVECLCIEFDWLKFEDCLKIIVVIVEVCVYGDLKENVEYYVVCEQQSFIEGCIGELEVVLFIVEVIDIIKFGVGNCVVFGVIVDLEDEDSGEVVIYQIVGDLEVDIKKCLIVVFLLIVCVLIGRSVGDSFEFMVFNGVKYYEIIVVCYV